MRKATKKNLGIIINTLILYIENQRFKEDFTNTPFQWFMSGYANDVIGSMTFLAYCNIVFSFRNLQVVKLKYLLCIMFFSGLFWEPIAPLFRADTFGDPYDMLAYLIGGCSYWMIIKGNAPL